MKAFPTVTGSTGMELRDYFAAKAMQELVKVWVETDIVNLEMITKDAYKIADAMIKAREEE